MLFVMAFGTNLSIKQRLCSIHAWAILQQFLQFENYKEVRCQLKHFIIFTQNNKFTFSEIALLFEHNF